jgi:ribonuclease-3
MTDEYQDALTSFAARIGVTFTDITILRTAFTHRSYVNEHRGEPIEHNERLEFLGDAVLELAVTDFLFTTYLEKTEGELTAYRAALVNTTTIGEVASELSMNDLLLLSKGESRDTGRARQYILANTFEAVIGAIYLDQGYTAAQLFISDHIFPRAQAVVEKRLWQDSKSYFQERAQEAVGVTPSYVIVNETGPDHDKKFTVAACLEEEQVATGEGRSKQEAEQAAAHEALKAKGWGT